MQLENSRILKIFILFLGATISMSALQVYRASASTNTEDDLVSGNVIKIYFWNLITMQYNLEKH